MKTVFACFFWSFCLVAKLFAQTDQTLDDMITDSQKSKKSIVWKTNPITMLSGDFPLYAELRLSRKFSVEAGIGFQASYFLREWPYIVFGTQPFAINPDGMLEVRGGYSLRAFPKYYCYGDNLEGVAVGPFWRMRQYNIINSDQKVRFTDLCLMFSQQSGLNRSRIFFEYYVGFGVRMPHFPETVMAVNGKKHFVAPWGVKLGYGF